jgi:hypothetical protein
MFLHPFHPSRFLRSVYGSDSFVEYCRDRDIAFDQVRSSPFRKDDERRWAAALAELPHDRQAQVELELATVNEMAGADATAHLLGALEGSDSPPDSITSGAPLALWFLLRHPTTFREVFFQHEIGEIDCWRTGRAKAGLPISDLSDKSSALADALREYFLPQAGAGAFCTAVAHWAGGSLCFVAQVADRLQFISAFSENGKSMTYGLRPAQPVLFVYRPEDGSVSLMSRLRSRERIAALFALFGRVVLDGPVSWDDAAFDLDVLKGPFRPLPDAPDMESIRLKSLHLRYPAQAGRRQIKLETLSTDGPVAMETLLAAHVGSGVMGQLRVSHAELQVKLRIEGRCKSYPIRLWRNRSNISRSPVGDRFRACLERWGLVHAP